MSEITSIAPYSPEEFQAVIDKDPRMKSAWAVVQSQFSGLDKEYRKALVTVLVLLHKAGGSCDVTPDDLNKADLNAQGVQYKKKDDGTLTISVVEHEVKTAALPEGTPVVDQDSKPVTQ